MRTGCGQLGRLVEMKAGGEEGWIDPAAETGRVQNSENDFKKVGRPPSGGRVRAELEQRPFKIKESQQSFNRRSTINICSMYPCNLKVENGE